MKVPTLIRKPKPSASSAIAQGWPLLSLRATVEPAPDGARHGNVEIALLVYDREGKPLNLWSQKVKSTLTQAIC
ncbi:MAG TPA: hypothetical protein VH350_03385 [Candidatus Sulfotelmatobacter sp.]|nr:hypothetical protein [Candidatus Sulfotelmatobacter sp.]